MKKPRKSAKPAQMDWLDWHRFNRDYAHKLLRDDGEIYGSIFIFHARDDVHAHSVHFSDPQQKALAYKFLLLKAIALEAEAVVMIAEAWALEPLRMRRVCLARLPVSGRVVLCQADR